MKWHSHYGGVGGSGIPHPKKKNGLQCYCLFDMPVDCSVDLKVWQEIGG